jgi:ankyrin repeat protein
VLAIKQNKPKMVEAILKHVNSIEFVNKQQNDGYRALHFAVLNQNLELIYILIRYGAEINYKDNGKKKIKRKNHNKIINNKKKNRNKQNTP